MYLDPVSVAQAMIQFDRPAPDAYLRCLRVQIRMLLQQSGAPDRLGDRRSLIHRQGDEGLPLRQCVNHFYSKITHCLP